MSCRTRPALQPYTRHRLYHGTTTNTLASLLRLVASRLYRLAAISLCCYVLLPPSQQPVADIISPPVSQYSGLDWLAVHLAAIISQPVLVAGWQPDFQPSGGKKDGSCGKKAGASEEPAVPLAITSSPALPAGRKQEESRENTGTRQGATREV